MAELGTTAITLTGGETLLHPELEEVIGGARTTGCGVDDYEWLSDGVERIGS